MQQSTDRLPIGEAIGLGGSGDSGHVHQDMTQGSVDHGGSCQLPAELVDGLNSIWVKAAPDVPYDHLSSQVLWIYVSGWFPAELCGTHVLSQL